MAQQAIHKLSMLLRLLEVTKYSHQPIYPRSSRSYLAPVETLIPGKHVIALLLFPQHYELLTDIHHMLMEQRMQHSTNDLLVSITLFGIEAVFPLVA